MTRWFGGGLAAVSLLLAACQSLPPPVPESAPAGRQLEVPFFAQDRYQCGPASLAMVMGWAGITVTPEGLVPQVWLPKRKGSLAMELEGAARARGLLVYPVNTPKALFAEVNAGHPVLVMQNLGFGFLPQWHYAVVTGYRDGGGKVVLNSGQDRNTTSYWNRFIRTWARARYRGFVTLPREEWPARVQPLPLVKALQALEQDAGARDAAPFWNQAAKRLPGSYLVQFGYGNFLWQQGEHRRAVTAFRAATRAKPDAWAGWNNLAEAYRTLGCHDKAKAAIDKAGSLAPDKPAVKQTAGEINGMRQTQCPLPAQAD